MGVNAVLQVLSTGLPLDEIRYPAGLVAYRLVRQLPPVAVDSDIPRVARPHPFENCDICEIAFRSPEPGLCPRCRKTSALDSPRGAA